MPARHLPARHLPGQAREDAQAACPALCEDQRLPSFEAGNGLTDLAWIRIGLEQQIHSATARKPDVDVRGACTVANLPGPPGPDRLLGFGDDGSLDAAARERAGEAAILGHTHERAD